MNVDGLLLVDKPCGISSRRVVNRVIQRLGKAKAGHCGTLDPLAEGLLIVGIGRGTRTMEHLISQPKTYRACVMLGVRTDTADLEGAPIERKHFDPPDAARVAAVFSTLHGRIKQVAPHYSALKHKGKRFYQLARNHQEVPHRERYVSIYSLQLEKIGEDDICFEVTCSKGTYIRTLAEMIGQKLGTVACLKTLQRTAIGEFRIEQAIPYQTLDEGTTEDIIRALVPVDQAFKDLPAITLQASLVQAFRCGQTIHWVDKTAQKIRVYSETHSFLGIAESSPQGLQPKLVMSHTDDHVKQTI